MRRFIAILCALATLIIASAARADARELYPYYNNDDQCLLIDSSGKVVSEAKYQSITPAYSPDGERRFIAYGANGSDTFAVLLDGEGQPLSDGKYDYIQEQNGSLITRRAQLMGVLGWDGAELLPPRYATIVPTGAGTYLTSTDDPYDEIADELYLTDESGASTYLNLCASSLSAFSDALVSARARNGKYGYLNAAGQWAIAPAYDTAEDFSDGKAVVTIDARAGLIDTSGGAILPAKYDSITSASYSGSAAVIVTIIGSTATIYDKTTLLPINIVDSVTSAYLPGFDLAVLGGADFSAVYDKNGKELLRVSADEYMEVLDDNHAIISDYSAGASTARIVDFSGREIISGINDAISLYADSAAYAIAVSHSKLRQNSNGMDVEVPNTTRWGVYSFDGKQILPVEYDSIASVCKGIFSVRQGQWYGLIDSAGHWIYKMSDYSELMD